MGPDPARLGLQGLGAANFAAILRDSGIVGHVLRFERANDEPSALERSA